MTLHIDYHVLQTVPPSNLNRDDTGSPKTAVYGGVRRARVSSQAWKRATRNDFKSHLDRDQLGVRTKRAVELLTARIEALAPEVDSATAAAMAAATLKKTGLNLKAKRNAKDADAEQTEYLVFFSNQQLDRLAALAVEAGEAGPDARTAKAAFDEKHSIDVALFGRMVANDADMNVDAACQVAHAISTHAVTTEFDYYTAVDDEAPGDETGAGMIGTIEFNSATLYRYATINVPSLQANLGDAEATSRAVEAFSRSFITSMPTGKQNTFANGTLPDAVVVMVRDGRPVNLVGAFEEAVGDAGGHVVASCRALASYAKDVEASFGGTPIASWVVGVGARADDLAELGEKTTLDALVDAVGGTRALIDLGGGMTVLLLRLAGPMQAWGDNSRFTRRDTRMIPTKSGVLGLLAAADGRRRTDPIEDLAGLRFGVRVDQPGQLQRDFQTAKDWDTDKSMPLSYRYYISDAVFLAGVEGERSLMEALAGRLEDPRFPLYLGRRSCPVTGQLVLGTTENDLVTALREHAWLASRWHRRTVSDPASLDLYVDAEPGEDVPVETRRDVPISYDPVRREYGWREVAQLPPVSKANAEGRRPSLAGVDWLAAVEES